MASGALALDVTSRAHRALVRGDPAMAHGEIAVVGHADDPVSGGEEPDVDLGRVFGDSGQWERVEVVLDDVAVGVARTVARRQTLPA